MHDKIRLVELYILHLFAVTAAGVARGAVSCGDIRVSPCSLVLNTMPAIMNWWDVRTLVARQNTLDGHAAPPGSEWLWKRRPREAEGGPEKRKEAARREESCDGAQGPADVHRGAAGPAGGRESAGSTWSRRHGRASRETAGLSCAP